MCAPIGLLVWRTAPPRAARGHQAGPMQDAGVFARRRQRDPCPGGQFAGRAGDAPPSGGARTVKQVSERTLRIRALRRRLRPRRIAQHRIAQDRRCIRSLPRQRDRPQHQLNRPQHQVDRRTSRHPGDKLDHLQHRLTPMHAPDRSRSIDPGSARPNPAPARSTPPPARAPYNSPLRRQA